MKLELTQKELSVLKLVLQAELVRAYKTCDTEHVAAWSQLSDRLDDAIEQARVEDRTQRPRQSRLSQAEKLIKEVLTAYESMKYPSSYETALMEKLVSAHVKIQQSIITLDRREDRA